MRIAFAGTGKLGTRLLAPILRSRHEVVAIVQNGRATRGVNRWLHPFLGQFTGDHVSVSGVGKRRGVPIVYIDKMTDRELEPLRKLEPDLLLVGGFAIILKKPILELPAIGCVNCHSSLLPMHRGPNPFSAVLVANESETGVTFHGMDEGIDTGPIVAQYAFPIGPEDTAGSLYHKAADLSGEKVLEVLDAVESNGITGTPQDPNEGCYDQKLTPSDLTIDWRKDAESIDRLVRAGYPFSLARFTYKRHTIYISRAKASAEPVDAAPGTVLDATRGALIATGHGTLRIFVAFAWTPVPSPWPSVFNCPKVGEVLP